MATINFSQNTYAGELLESILVYAAKGNDTVEKGLINIVSDIQYKYVLPNMVLTDDIIQDNSATPTTSVGTYDFGERYLEPKDFMVYLEFNPRIYEKYWKPWQPEGNLVFRELDPKLQAVMIRELLKKKNAYLGSAIWMSSLTANDATVTPPSGEPKLGAGKYKYFDGLLKRMLTNVKEGNANHKVIVAGNTALDSGEAIETALYTMWQNCPTQIRDENLSYVTSWDVWDKYDQYLTAKDVKYVQNERMNEYLFKNKRIIPINGMPAHTIVLGKFTNDQESNFWMGVDYANDTEVLKVERLQANSEMYFMQMRMKMDVNIVNPSEIVLWSNYTNAAG